MFSYLERIPLDVLQHIAFLSTPTCIFGSLATILRLMLTCSSLYQRLRLENCPHLYASIFRDQFDVTAPHRRLHESILTDSSLTAELLQRYRALRRIRHLELAGPGSEQDMWTIFWMILENDSRNITHLSRAGLSNFLLKLLRSHARRDTMSKAAFLVTDEHCSLVIWSYCLTMRRQNIMDVPVELVQELLILLRPFARRNASINSTPLASHHHSARNSIQGSDPSAHVSIPKSSHHEVEIAQETFHYSRRWRLNYPDASSAAIILTFALKELVPLQAPPHLPIDRASAIAHNRSGPTMEDYHLLASCKTPLFDDICPFVPTNLDACPGVSPSLHFDRDFQQILIGPPENVRFQGSPYIPGTLTGIWEGTFMLTPIVTSGTDPYLAADSDYICRQPIQCQLTEHLCFSPNIPIPAATGSTQHDNMSIGWNYSPFQLMPCKDGFEMFSNKFHYEKFDPPSSSSPCEPDPRQVLDVILTGETPPEYEHAWGSYRFAGKVRLDNGFITLKREPRYPGDDAIGSWLFEGYLHYGAAFVGQLYWQGTGVDACSMEGIFTLRKRTKS